MKIERLKPYKSCDPYSTIQKIRTVLKDCGIFTIESHFSIPKSNLYSCSVIVANEDLFDFKIQTNGKGLTPIYALASAYGEFMERLQNHWLFKYKDIAKYASKEFLNQNSQYQSFIKKLEKENLILDFIYAPDEVLLSYEELNIDQQYIYKELLPYNDSNLNDFINMSKKVKLPWLPFFDFKSQSIKYLPINLLQLNARTNGLCAGNTKEEAILQGICEVFERYAIREIFQKELTPPTISNDFFQGTNILERLDFMKEELGISYKIKDCSLGIGIPVIGLLLIDKKTNKVFFNLGSDVSPITALERCLTEAYQGISSYENIKFKKINLANDIFTQEKYKNIELDKIFKDATGCWPSSILYSKESYVFSGFDYPISKSDKEDLEYLLNKIDSLGFDLYIRDVSFLGFPAFNIFMPKISNIDFIYPQKTLSCKNIITDQIINYFNVPNIYKVKSSSNEELESILQILGILNTYGNFSLFPYNVDEDNRIDENLLSAMICYKLKRYRESSLFLSEYINNIEESFSMESPYFYCTRDYIYLKSESISNHEIENILSNMYNQELLSEVMEDLNDERDVFANARFPNCFNCNECEVAENCKFIHVLKIFKSFQDKQSKNIINQIDIATIIHK